MVRSQLAHLASHGDEIADAVIVAASDDRVQVWSRAAERLFGYPAGDALGRPLAPLVVPVEGVDDYHRQLARAALEGSCVYESVRRTSDGRAIVVSVSLTALRDEQGAVSHYVHSHRDMTRLAFQREAELLDARFWGLLDAAPDAMVVVDREGYILLVNQQAQQLFGYTRDELLGERIETLVPPRLRAAHRQHRAAFTRDPRVRPMGAGLELAGLRKGGVEFPIEISLSPLDTERGVLTMAAIRDTTARRRAEAQFRGLLEAAPDAMVIVTASGAIALVNAQTEQIFGYHRDELLGQPVEMLIPERYRSGHRQHRGRYFAAPQSRAMGIGLELYGVRRDGTEFPVEISLSPLPGEDGLVTISAIRDVTQQRALAERVRLLADEQAARAQAEAAVQTRNDFLSVAAHELKTPITSLRVFASLLLRQLDAGRTPAPGRLQLALESIDQQAEKLTRLINQLFDLSRIEDGRLTLAREWLDLMPLIQTAVRSAQAVTDRHQITFSGPNTAVACVDALRLEQVVTNLLDNAIKYSPGGGEIAVIVEVDGSLIRLRVRDHGVGVSEADREMIFDRFSRVDERAATAGLGLGLYLCRQIVEQHGGSISVEQADGGACFLVTLPAGAPPADSALPARREEAPQ